MAHLVKIAEYHRVITLIRLGYDFEFACPFKNCVECSDYIGNDGILYNAAHYYYEEN